MFEQVCERNKSSINPIVHKNSSLKYLFSEYGKETCIPLNDLKSNDILQKVLKATAS